MKSRSFITVVVALTLFATHAMARTPVPIVNHENIPVVTSSAKALSADQVKQAIMLVAAAKNWSIGFQSDGKLQATLVVRNKHTIVVEIAYSPEKYSLTYKDSINMKHGQLDGHAVIHPYYNKWVQELKDGIRAELMKG